MLFTLVKNELIKMFKRGKTWIVFGLFCLSMVGLVAVQKINADGMEHWRSPQGQIEMIDNNLNWQKEELKNATSQLNDFKSRKESKEVIKSQEEHILSLKSEIDRLESERKHQEKILATGVAVDWRETVKTEIANLKNELKGADQTKENKEYIQGVKQQIENKQYLLDNNIKPVERWELYPGNLAIQGMTILGMVILVAGIAVFMSDIVSGECTPATVKFLLVQPISRAKVILSKFIAVIITVVGLICGAEIATFGIVGAFTGFSDLKMPVELGIKYQVNQEVLLRNGYKQIDRVIGSGYQSTMGDYVLQSFLLQVLFIIACCAFVFMISALFKSSMITMAVSVIISVASTVLPMVSEKISEIAQYVFLNYGSTPSVITGDIAFMYHNNIHFTPQLGVITMIITIILSYIVAHFVFIKRDMLM
ncbi:ABC transporter permease [Clostridium sp. Ade.TY]|uniref:ABC transporter permease n=1 Tax=Clostridium sp. Ade.TY TaxID=1391647 RepID=UPI0003FFA4D3|nr:ABC transporter permease [Clostridium sp. Ade.TY]